MPGKQDLCISQRDALGWLLAGWQRSKKKNLVAFVAHYVEGANWRWDLPNKTS